jgi:hypothetical protein
VSGVRRAAVTTFNSDVAKATNRDEWIFHLLHREAEQVILPKKAEAPAGPARSRD